MTAPQPLDAARVQLITRRMVEFLSKRPASRNTAPNGIAREMWWDQAGGVVTLPETLADSAASWDDPLASHLGKLLSEALGALRVAQRPEKYRRHNGPQSKKEMAAQLSSIELSKHPGLVFDDTRNEADALMREVLTRMKAARRLYLEDAETRWSLLRGFHASMKNKDATFQRVIMADRVLAELTRFDFNRRWSKARWDQFETRLARCLLKHGMAKNDIVDFLMRVDAEPADEARRIWRNITRS